MLVFSLSPLQWRTCSEAFCIGASWTRLQVASDATQKPAAVPTASAVAAAARHARLLARVRPRGSDTVYNMRLASAQHLTAPLQRAATPAQIRTARVCAVTAAYNACCAMQPDGAHRCARIPAQSLQHYELRWNDDDAADEDDAAENED